MSGPDWELFLLGAFLGGLVCGMVGFMLGDGFLLARHTIRLALREELDETTFTSDFAPEVWAELRAMLEPKAGPAPAPKQATQRKGRRT